MQFIPHNLFNILDNNKFLKNPANLTTREYTLQIYSVKPYDSYNYSRILRTINIVTWKLILLFLCKILRYYARRYYWEYRKHGHSKPLTPIIINNFMQGKIMFDSIKSFFKSSTIKTIFTFVAAITLLTSITSCGENKDNSVVIYTSVDQVFSEKILSDFEKESGIIVKAVYDVEASKTVGLEKRLLAEKNTPQADVFWNSEHIRTLRLVKKDLFTPYTPTNSASIPNQYKDTNKQLWTGFGIRARVLVVNKDQIKDQSYPTKLTDLLDPKWKGKACIAKPLFGTTSTHFTALYTRDGKEKMQAFIDQLKANDIAILTGNSHVRDAVVSGEYVFGLTDTDDATVSIQKGAPIDMVFMNQESEGSFAVFQTVALIKNGPNVDNGKKLINYIISKQVENTLMDMGAVQLSVRSKGESSTKLWTDASDVMVENISVANKLIKNNF